MTVKELKKESLLAMNMMKLTGMVDDDVYNFIMKSVNGDTGETETYFKVPAHEYISELKEKVPKMDNENLGKFVRNTLWVVTGEK